MLLLQAASYLLPITTWAVLKQLLQRLVDNATTVTQITTILVVASSLALAITRHFYHEGDQVTVLFHFVLYSLGSILFVSSMIDVTMTPYLHYVLPTGIFLLGERLFFSFTTTARSRGEEGLGYYRSLHRMLVLFEETTPVILGKLVGELILGVSYVISGVNNFFASLGIMILEVFEEPRCLVQRRLVHHPLHTCQMILMIPTGQRKWTK